MRRRPLLIAALSLLIAAATAWAAPPRAERTVSLPGEPRAGVVAGDRLWLLVDRDGVRHLVAVGPGRRGVTFDRIVFHLTSEDLARVQTSTSPRPALMFAGGFLWTIDPADGTLAQIARADASVARTTLTARYVAVGPAGLWAIQGGPPTLEPDGIRHRIFRIEPVTREIIGFTHVGPGIGSAAPTELAVGRGVLWVATAGGGRRGLTLDLATGVAVPFGGAWQLFARDGLLAATHRSHCEVALIGPGGPTDFDMRGLPPCYPRDVALGRDGRLWAAYTSGGRRGRLAVRRPDRRALASSTAIGRDPVDVIPAGRGVWVLDRAGRRATRFD